jgi:hypothetical protein
MRGQGFLTIELKFDKHRILKVLEELEIEINADSKSALKYFITEDPEKFLHKYCGVEYEKGTFKRCDISESQNKIMFLTFWGFLMNFQNQIMFSIGSKIYSFSDIPFLNLGFIAASQDSDEYKKYN